MWKLSFTIAILLLYQLTTLSQPCLPEGITFSTQEQIDDFQANHPNCTEIEGSVEISGDDIVSLYGLNVLTNIGGNLSIYGNDSLTNLTGLENLDNIYGSLQIGKYVPHPGYIIGNPSLINLLGLDNLVSVEGYLEIYENDVLSSLTSLGTLTNIGGLIIACNNSLESLNGLEGITYIEGMLVIGFEGSGWNWGNSSLTSLSGLDALTAVEGGIWISHNNTLSNLTGLNALTYVGGYEFSIHDNQSLVDLTGLNSLSSVYTDLNITFNNSLLSLTGLENVAAGSIENLKIRNNNSLSICEVQSICDYLASPNGTVVINNNAPGCDSPEEVIDACDTGVIVKEVNAQRIFTIVPNPLNSIAVISYTLDQSSIVELSILDLSGRLVATLINEYQQQGEQKVVFNSEKLKPGIYFCTLKTNEGMQTRKIIKL